ncbi:MAG: hypothetical protein J7639_28820, partial [Paenibacillaceae bacterium]|nr:hypothetical protein [Paenibacillaceae bacterium]
VLDVQLGSHLRSGWPPGCRRSALLAACLAKWRVARNLVVKIANETWLIGLISGDTRKIASENMAYLDQKSANPVFFAE